MSSFDVLKEIEYAIKKIVTSSKTRYIMLRAKKLVKANPSLEKYLTPKVGWGLSFVLSKYQQEGLIKILGTQRGHVMKFFIYVEDEYFDYARQLEQQLQAQAPTLSTS